MLILFHFLKTNLQKHIYKLNCVRFLVSLKTKTLSTSLWIYSFLKFTLVLATFEHNR